jgi:hypothetical protein
MANSHAPDTPHWEAAFEYYYQDQMVESYVEIRDHGVGEAGELLRWYRVIEAESETRLKSEVLEVNDWLSLEFVPDETMGLEIELGNRTLEACNQVAERLGWTHSVATRLAILAEETDAPWATNPYGYCVSKEPYEKICLPNYLVDDESEFSQAVAHEYAHVISTHLTDEYAPRWVEEAVSVLVERRFDIDAWQKFKQQPSAWLSVVELESVLIDRSDDDGTKDEIWLAYQQAGWIGRFLSQRNGDAALGTFLAEIANESPILNLFRIFLGRDRTEAALRRVYGLSQRDLFEKARLWMSGLEMSEV